MDSATQAETLPAPIGPIAEGVAARIAAERRRLTAEEANESRLIAERKALLSGDDDTKIDDVENSIGASRSCQLRTLERLSILGEQLVEANAKAASDALDAIAARANQARELGERLIKIDYPRIATELSGVLARLAAIDRVVEESNVQLARAGRERVSSPNAVRVRRSRCIEWTERQRVSVDDPRHPLYGHTYSTGPILGGPLSHFKNGSNEPVESFAELDVTKSKVICADMPFPLWQDIECLPSADAAPVPCAGSDLRSAPPIWRGGQAYRPPAVDIAAIRAEIEERPTTKRKG